MSGHFDFRVGEDLAGDGLQFTRQVREHATRRNLTLDDRHRRQERVGLDVVVQRVTTGVRSATHFGAGWKTVAIDVYGGDSTAVFCGGVRAWLLRQTQACLEEGEGIENPATALVVHLKKVRRQRQTPPIANDDRIESFAGCIAQRECRCRPLGQYRNRRQITGSGLHRCFKSADQRLVLMSNGQGLGTRRSFAGQAHALEQNPVFNRQTGEKNHRHVLVQTRANEAVERRSILRRTAGHPRNHPGIQATEAIFRHGAVGRQVVDPIPQVFEQSPEIGMTGIISQVTFARVVNQRYTSRLHFDVADTHRIQVRGADKRNETFIAQTLGQLAGLLTLFRWQIVDRHQWNALGTQRLQLAQQPLAVRLRHGSISLGRCIPTGIQRLESYRCRHAVELRQHFKATIEKQLQFWLLLVQLPQKTRKAGTLCFTGCFWQ
ncbi:hypothetical protein D3C84_425290 [compost metagenome]